MAREVIIKIIGDDKDIDLTINKLVKLGEVDQKNAKQFQTNNNKYRELQSKNLGIIEKARLKEKTLMDMRNKSNSPKMIAKYNRMIDTQRKKVGKLTSTTKTHVQQMGKMEGMLQNIGVAMIAAFSVQQLITFGSELKKLSIQLEADAKKNAIVFGAELERVTEAAKENAIAIGLTTNEYIRSAASTQDLLVPLGFARKEAAGMSIDLTNLAGSLSVWSGGTVDAAEVSRILTKALLGETEQLKTLGVLVDQSSTDFNKRIKDTLKTTDLTQQQAKAMDILNQIFEKSIDAQTSFSDGQETLAEANAKVNAELRTQKEILAKELAPAWGIVLKMVTQQMDKWAWNIKGLKIGWEKFTELFTGPKEQFGQTLEELSAGMTQVNKDMNKATKTTKANNEEDKNKLTLIDQLNAKLKIYREQLDEQAVSGDINNETLDKYVTLLQRLKKAQDLVNASVEQGIKGFKFGTIEKLAAAEFELEFMKEIDEESADNFSRSEEMKTEALKGELAIRQALNRKHEAEALQLLNGGINQAISSFSKYYSWKLGALQNQIDNGQISEEAGAAKKRELLNEQAKTERELAIFKTTINIATAVATALTAGPVVGQILAALTAAAGAVELGTILSTPVPKFAKGTKGKKGSGMALVGEEGPELTFLPNDAKVLPADKTKQHSGIIDAMYDNTLDQYIMKNYIPKLIPQLPEVKKDERFINTLIQGLGSEGFNEDGIIETMKGLDKNESKRMDMLIGAIRDSSNKRVNLRKQ